MAQQRYDVRQELLTHLLDKIDQDTYPSGTMMDLAEQLLLPDDVPDYAEVLLGKLRGDAYPSLDLVRRLSSLAGA